MKPEKYNLFTGKHNSLNKYFSLIHFPLLFTEKWDGKEWLMGLSFIIILTFIIFCRWIIITRRRKEMIANNKNLESIIAARTNALNQQLAELEVSERDKKEQIYILSRLVTSISHDVQSPLKYMSYLLKLIPDMLKSQDNENILKAIAVVAHMSDSMSTMLEQLIEFSKMKFYGKHLTLESIDIHKLIQEKASIFQGIIESNESKFYNKIPKGTRVDTDLRLLSIIVYNLLDNAAKFTIGGEISASLEVTTDATQEIVITNTGTNTIPPEVIKMINSVEKYSSVDGLFDSGNVKGLGLLIVKEISDLAHISVHVYQSTHTRFKLIIPRPVKKVAQDNFSN
jgi:signal transduction histidine kinase